MNLWLELEQVIESVKQSSAPAVVGLLHFLVSAQTMEMNSALYVMLATS
jgi:hypothetical protein